EQVLGAPGNPVERPAVVAAHDLGLRRARLGAGELGRGSREGVEPRGVALDPVEIGLGQLDRREAARADAARQLRDGEAEDVFAEGTHAPLLPAPRLRPAVLSGRNTNAIPLPGGSG